MIQHLQLPLRVFLSYSRRNEGDRLRLTTHLKPLERDGLVALWDDTLIRPAEDWSTAITDQLMTCDICLLLVTADFLASDYCYGTELSQAMVRHERGELQVVPVFARHCDWRSAPFGRLQGIPRAGAPISSYDDPDLGWAEAAKLIRRIAEHIVSASSGDADPEAPVSGVALATTTETAEIELTINKPFRKFSAEDQLGLLRAIAELIDVSDLKITRTEPGSTVVRIMLPREAAERLRDLIADGALAELDVESSRLVPPGAPKLPEQAYREQVAQLASRQAGKLATLHSAFQGISRASKQSDLEALLDKVVDSAISAVGADRGFLVFLDESDQTQHVRVARHRGAAALGADLRYSTSIVGKALQEMQPVRTIVHSGADALDLGESVFDLQLRSAMCVPMTFQANPDRDGKRVERGCLYVDSRIRTREFQEEDETILSTLGHHVSVALDNATLSMQRMEAALQSRELEIAAEIQRDMVHSGPWEASEGRAAFACYMPAASAGGDLCDLFETQAGEVAIVVGDVTGHGVSAALIAATAHSALRAYAKSLREPGEVVAELNRDLCERADDGRFLSLFFALLDAGGRLRWTNAGHTPPLLLRWATQEIEVLPTSCPALGIIEEFASTAREVQLLEGDTLLVFTDGLVEARNIEAPRDVHEFFDEARVRQTLAEFAQTDQSLRELVEGLVASVLDFSGGAREDDMTILAVRRTPRGDRGENAAP